MKYEEALQALTQFNIVDGGPATIFLLPEPAMKEIYQTIVANRFTNCLELGSGYGATSCVMAAAAKEIGGRVTTVDIALHYGANPNLLKDHMGIDNLDIIIDPLGYNWYMADLIQNQSKDNVCEPIFDFVFLDGAHEWSPDALATFLAIKLLKPGGAIALDDVNFHLRGMSHWKQTHGSLSDRELDTRQIEMVYNLVLQQHPDMTNFRISTEGRVGWGQKIIPNQHTMQHPMKSNLLRRAAATYQQAENKPIGASGAMLRKTFQYLQLRLGGQGEGSGQSRVSTASSTEEQRTAQTHQGASPAESLPSGIMITTNTNVGPMAKGRILNQKFSSTKDGLCGISLWVATYCHQIKSTARLQILDIKSKQMLRQVVVNTSDFQDNTWQRFDFEPIDSSANQSFMMQFETDGYMGSNSRSEAITLWSNNSVQGICKINDRNQREAVCFRCHYPESQANKNG